MHAALQLDWAEPGELLRPDFDSVRAKPLAKLIAHSSLTREVESHLVRRYHDGCDEAALERLVGAHRPMVVRMAKGMFRGNGTSLAALIEYGMVGLRLAAQPPRPSLTKKGKMVGFDPEKGNRFGTYARSYARKEMLAALADDPPALNLDFEQKVTTLFEDWKAPVCEQHYESSDEVEERDDDPPLDAGGHKILFREMERRRPYAKPKKRWPVTDPPRKQNERPPNPIAPTLWHPPIWALDQFRRKVRTRNFLKHPRTPLELANLGTYQAGYWTILKAFEKVAGEAMEGWADEDLDPLWSDQAEFLVASFLRSHVLKGKQFALPKSVLQERWQLGCERLGKKIRFEFNRGLGLFDRWGHRLPDYDALYSDDNVKIIRKQKRVPWLSLKPLAGIYYMQGTDTLEVFSWRRYRPKDTDEMATPFNEVLPVRLPDGARKELAKIAERRYQSACSLARQAIMALIEKAKKEEAKNAA